MQSHLRQDSPERERKSKTSRNTEKEAGRNVAAAVTRMFAEGEERKARKEGKKSMDAEDEEAS